MPTISIITVCYNAEKEIERTIKSVVSQTYTDKEYVIIDGASKDGTLNIINKYKDNIQKVVSEPDKGIYDAMNKGIKAATGEWIIMMNAGDVFASDTVLEEIFSTQIPEDKSFLYSDVLMHQGKNWQVCPMSFKGGALNHQCVIYKKKLHERIGWYIVTKKLIVSDYLFFIQVPEEETLKVDTIIAKYDGGGASTSFNARQDALCADVVFKRISFKQMIMLCIAKNIGDMIPKRMKYALKKRLFNKD